MVNQSRGPYNLPAGNRDVDSLTYNPQADAGPDNAAFDESTDAGIQPVGARGADIQPTYRDYQGEDLDTERSEQTGQIPRGEVEDLLSSTTQDERDLSVRTRGKKVDAYKQERDLDQSFEETGLADADQDVEIGRATGR
ncbi:hypothetical protein C8Q79DRAFT_950000 [Trametes meyenii]|nr:hypothetical protein C8Q79DRAFT_950000 [Trametes meyenii]